MRQEYLNCHAKYISVKKTHGFIEFFTLHSIVCFLEKHFLSAWPTASFVCGLLSFYWQIAIFYGALPNTSCQHALEFSAANMCIMPLLCL